MQNSGEESSVRLRTIRDRFTAIKIARAANMRGQSAIGADSPTGAARLYFPPLLRSRRQEFAKVFVAEMGKWAKVVQQVGIDAR